jgi:hypothetical protein
MPKKICLQQLLFERVVIKESTIYLFEMSLRKIIKNTTRNSLNTNEFTDGIFRSVI